MLTSNLICTHPERIICIKWSAILQFQPEICLLHIKKQYIPKNIPIHTNTYCYIPLHVYTYQYTIHTNTFTYIPIHARAQIYTAPYLRSARPDWPILFPVCSQCCGQHCTRIWKAEGGEAPSGDAECCLPLVNWPRKHESARWRSPCASTWPLSHAQLMPTV